MKTNTWFDRNRFPLALGAILVAFEAGLFVFTLKATPPGMRWLGDYMGFPSDIAVYLSYLRQGSLGHLLLDNLYSVEPHALRFDAFWSVLGIFARTKIDVVLLHEISRWLLTPILAFAIYLGAKVSAKNERDARLAAILAVLIPGMGWTYSVWLTKIGAWQWNTMSAADVVYELAVFPMLLVGTHAILSLALLLTSQRLVWESWAEKNMRRAWLAAACNALLLSFHPYFVPLCLTYWSMAWLVHRKVTDGKTVLRLSAIQATALLPVLAVYMPLASDEIFRTHHLVTNQLLLPPALSWIGTLAPFAVALAWRFARKIKIQPRERWLIAWLLSAAICIVLPLPWKRKYLEGLGPALVWLTLPFWCRVRDLLLGNAKGFSRALMASALLLAAGFDVFHLLISELTWIGGRDTAKWFYQPNEIFAAWDHLAQADRKTVAISDDMNVNVWTPAYAGRVVWVAHDHETPDFKNKFETWRKLLQADDPEEAHKMLGEAGVTDFITTSASSTERFKRLLGDGWEISFQRGQFSIFHKD